MTKIKVIILTPLIIGYIPVLWWTRGRNNQAAQDCVTKGAFDPAFCQRVYNSGFFNQWGDAFLNEMFVISLVALVLIALFFLATLGYWLYTGKSFFNQNNATSVKGHAPSEMAIPTQNS